jgi:uncharacterized Fe-S cluster-containing radical SAM superfamily protein
MKIGKVQTRIFEVNISYNIESEDACKALDTVLSCSPLKPTALSVESVQLDEEDDD